MSGAAQQRRQRAYDEWRAMFPDDSYSAFTYAYEAGANNHAMDAALCECEHERRWHSYVEGGWSKGRSECIRCYDGGRQHIFSPIERCTYVSPRGGPQCDLPWRSHPHCHAGDGGSLHDFQRSGGTVR